MATSRQSRSVLVSNSIHAQPILEKLMEKISVAVCVATYKRPVGLRRLLESLRSQAFVSHQTPDWKIIVVDNDASAPNQDYINELSAEFPIPILYAVQPKRGIASVRNLAVALSKDVDYVAFIDDDEIADPYWLDELLTGVTTHQADVITGPVLPIYEEPPKDWIVSGRFFERDRFPTGTTLDYARTGNVLISRKYFRLCPEPFEESLNLTGGEDTLFFAQIQKKGARIVWVDEAITHEYNPPQRTNLNWLLKRSIRMGNTIVQIERMADKSIKNRIIRILKCAGHLVGGLLLIIPLGIISGFAGVVKGLCIVSRGVGELMALLGIHYEIYKDTPLIDDIQQEPPVRWQ
jgi:succinoglycan biosynthesis protein ExoM